ncbi:MAG: LptF/LptG family permease [Proteobacteria bacterium]|nr:LptF/LptG family permease [Pseudomonadota bacterium]
MKLYAKYLFQKTSLAFAAIIGVLILLIWFSRAIGFVKYVTENGVALSKFFYLFVLILPWLLLFITPVSLLAAILLIFNRMSSSNEITILKNSGLTKLQICRPIILLATILSIFCFAISFYLMPYANKELRLSRINIKNNYTSLSFAPQTFETMKNLTIYARDRDEKNQLFGILIHDKRNPNYSLTITAQSGRILVEDKSALLYMENGTVQKFNYQSHESEILNFDSYVFNLTENNKSDSSLRWKTGELYLSELLNPSEDLEKSELEKYRVEINQRFTYPLLPIAFALISMAMVMSGQFSRHGNLTNTLVAILASAAFLVLTIASYNLIALSPYFIPLPYLNFLLFLVLSLKMLEPKK